MISIIDKTKCCGCEACAQVCPVSCITTHIDDEGFRYPLADADLCIDCGLCDRTCPELMPYEPLNDVQNDYATFSLDEVRRASSSSGGVFYELAKAVIDVGGTVCAAAYDDLFNVHHICVDDLAELEKLQGSKYVQSNIGESYKDVQSRLEEGKQVLFVGTECQVAGLKKYLAKEYELLLCVGVVCHGVPSQAVWQSYLNSVVAGEKLVSLNMRDKSSGWSKYMYSWEFTFENGDVKRIPQGEVPFMKGFVSDYYLRPSCYDCSFKGLSRVADITLGDFWGVWESYPEMDDDKGTSLVMIHSDKGQEAYDAISGSIRCKEVSIDDAVKNNPSILKSSSLTPRRDEFFERFSNGESIEEIVDDLNKRNPSTSSQIMNKLKRLIK